MAIAEERLIAVRDDGSLYLYCKVGGEYEPDEYRRVQAADVRTAVLPVAVRTADLPAPQKVAAKKAPAPKKATEPAKTTGKPATSDNA